MYTFSLRLSPLSGPCQHLPRDTPRTTTHLGPPASHGSYLGFPFPHSTPLKLARATYLVLTAEKAEMEGDYSEVGKVHGPDGTDLKQTKFVWQGQCVGPGSTTLTARVHVVGLRTRGWPGHGEVESEGFASHPVSLKASRTDVAGTYLPGSLQPFGKQPCRVVLYAIVREAGAQGCAGRLERMMTTQKRKCDDQNCSVGCMDFAMVSCLRAPLPTIGCCKHDLGLPIPRSCSSSPFPLADS